MRSKADHTAAVREHRKAAVVVNTKSRRGRKHYDEVLRLIRAAGFAPLGEFPVDDPKRLRATLDQALGLGPDLLIVGGGDGTLSSAVKHIVHRDVALGVLPLGTTNNFARSLGLARSPTWPASASPSRWPARSNPGSSGCSAGPRTRSPR
jgi:diacylglycerol kinase family enzyme